jgi:hypothetical protein
LADVLPASLLATMAAPSTKGTLEWTSGSAAVHLLGVCRAPRLDHADAGPAGPAAEGSTPSAPDDFEPIEGRPDFVRVAGLAGDTAFESGHADGHGRSDALVGTLVHRLLHRLGAGGASSADAVASLARQVVRESDGVTGVDLDAVALRAAQLYRELRAKPQVRAVYDRGTVYHEVPFSMLSEGGLVVRGAIDCVAEMAPNQVTILEFKTGRPQPWHERQLETYRLAVASLVPGAAVAGHLVYASAAGSRDGEMPPNSGS